MTDPLLPPVVQMLEVAPTFVVSDLAAAAARYRETLGFSVEADDEARPPSVTLSRDGIAIVLEQREAPSDGALCPGRARIWVADLESLSIELRLRGAELLAEGGTAGEGHRFEVRDDDGNVLCFDQLVD